MDFFIKENNIRPGNRGGRNLFNWEDVRVLCNRDRQSYLGSTQALGLMDRGGKWYKKDWWLNYNDKINVYGKKDELNNKSALLEEQKEVRAKEREKLNEYLYGKKNKNNNINVIVPKNEGKKQQNIQIQKKEEDKQNITPVVEEDNIKKDNEIVFDLEGEKNLRRRDIKKDINYLKLKGKNYIPQNLSHNYHHYHHNKQINHKKNYDRSRSHGKRSRSRSRSRSRYKHKIK